MNQDQPDQRVYGADIHRQNVQGVPLGAVQGGIGQGAANLRPQIHNAKLELFTIMISLISMRIGRAVEHQLWRTTTMRSSLA